MLAPDGALTPDLAAKLPGRGAWVSADRESVNHAARKGLFSKDFQTHVVAPEDLADHIEIALEERCLQVLGLARRAGDLAAGFDQVRDGLKSWKPAWLICARDGGADGRSKVLRLAHAAHKEVPVAGCFLAHDVGRHTGRGPTAHAALRAGAAATRFGWEVGRLAGFRPLTPLTWLNDSQHLR